VAPYRGHRAWLLPVFAAGAACVFVAPVVSFGRMLPLKPEAVRVAGGSTAVADWTLYARRSRKFGFCTTVQLRSKDGKRSPVGEGCGWRPPTGVGSMSAQGLGTVASGAAVKRVARVRVRFADGVKRWAKFYPSPPRLGFRGRFWVVVRTSMCGLAGVRALDREGETIKLFRLGPPPGVDPGEPDPSGSCR
jgi:hypothetical protein